MNKVNKFFSLILSMTICLSNSQGLAISQEIPINKLSLDLQKALEDVPDEETIPICIWIEDINYEEVENNVFSKTGLSDEILFNVASELYKPLNGNSIQKIEEKFGVINDIEVEQVEVVGDFSSDIKNVDIKEYIDFYETNYDEISKLSSDVDTYISEKRFVAKAEYTKHNNEFVDEYLKSNTINFISSYAPMIILESNKEKIYELEAIDKVESISLCINHKFNDFGNINVSIPSIDGNYIRDTLGYNGYGVKIGQIEPGRPNTTYSELSLSNITQDGTLNNNYHASLVASIMVGSSGMVPQAHLFCTTATNNIIFYQNAEWLISSGVKVINCSAGYYNEGNYDDTCKWVDHVVNQHNVSWIQASGNDGEGDCYVCTPGNAYNAITVGSIDDNGTISTIDDTYDTETCYNISANGIGMKPDVVAPGVGFSLSNGGVDKGTSYATPHVTGMVAQMMQYIPTLSLRPDAIKVAVLSSCNRKVTNEFLGWITNKEGAGVINAIRAIDSIVNCSILSPTTTYITHSYTPQSLGFKKFAISWIKQNTNTGTNHDTINTDPAVTNFNLRVYDSSGNIVASSLSEYNNAELVGFTVNSIQTYTIKIERVNSFSTNEKISYTYWE